MKSYLPILSLIVIFFGCRKIKIGQEKTMVMNKEYRVDDQVKITIDSLNDYRCPKEGICVWGGDVDVYFRISDGASTMDTLLRTDIEPSLVSFKQYSLRVTEFLHT